ncbi:MAG: hypothetical protein KAJ42_09345 [Gemmatimonadetes bacterium]|nr:hypothetical protein [Gemmatimonadota bacterium]
MTKVYSISTYYGQYEPPSFRGIYSSPAMVAAFLDDRDEWDDDSVGVTEYIVDIHSPAARHFDDNADYDGRSVPKEKFKPFSEMS